MSELIQMRQRIKAIETIKKITHAMRLISMSSHSRLKNKEDTLHEYTEKLRTLFLKIQAYIPEEITPFTHPATNNKSLCILIGSQKGLCGSFNNSLFQLFSRHISDIQKYDIIVIGKRAVNYIHAHDFPEPVATYEEFNIRTLFTITHHVSTYIISAKHSYTDVIVWSNTVKNFFVQKPVKSTLIPLDIHATKKSASPEVQDDYLWEHTPAELLHTIATQYLEARIQQLLFESLLAEHAARFVSMDNSTRNAKNLLDTTKLRYNKLRQAKITKELIELSGSF